MGTSLENGHYISYVKKGDDWYECNDKCVKIINRSYDIDTFIQLDCKNKNMDPYMLFYEKKTSKMERRIGMMKNFTKNMMKPNANVSKLTKTTTIDDIQAAKVNKNSAIVLSKAKIDEGNVTKKSS